MPSEIPHTEKELFRIAEDDEKAFRQLFDLYKERLFVFVWQLSHSAVEAEEIVQDIFMKLWENREKLVQVEFPRKYIYTMTRNRTLDLLAKIAKDQQLIREVWANISQSDNHTEEILEAQESRQLIDQAIGQLSEKKQAIFRMSRRDGLNHQDIAAQMGISIQTVKNILTEILKHIKTFLAGHSELLAILFWVKYYALLF